MTFGGHEVGKQLQRYDLVEREMYSGASGTVMYPIHAPPVIGIGEAKETRRRSAGSVAEVWAFEEIDKHTIADALIMRRGRLRDRGFHSSFVA